jgi:TonB family protein
MRRSIFLLGLLWASVVTQAFALASGPSEPLPAPVQISPALQARLHGYPRTVVFEWSKVPGAKGYGIQTDYYGGGHWASEAGRPTFITWVKDPSFTHDFIGDQPGSWRVWAIDNDGHPGQVSAWSVFTFSRGSGPIPPPPPATTPDFSRFPATFSPPVPQGKMRALPVFDPRTGEACPWPPPVIPGASWPKAIYSPEPESSEAALKAKQSGAVEAAVEIGSDGLVKRVCILRASRDDLGEQAVNTIRTWRFEPSRKDGVPVPSSLSVTVSFNLR